MDPKFEDKCGGWRFTRYLQPLICASMAAARRRGTPWDFAAAQQYERCRGSAATSRCSQPSPLSREKASGFIVPRYCIGFPRDIQHALHPLAETKEIILFVTPHHFWIMISIRIELRRKEYIRLKNIFVIRKQLLRPLRYYYSTLRVPTWILQNISRRWRTCNGLMHKSDRSAEEKGFRRHRGRLVLLT